MKQYTILRVTESEVICREVNPYEKPESEDYLNGDFSHLFNEADFKANFYLWQEAENNLKEYELTEDSLYSGQYPEYGYSASGRIPIWMNRILRDFKVGQVINGELISENGTDKIKVI